MIVNIRLEVTDEQRRTLFRRLHPESRSKQALATRKDFVTLANDLLADSLQERPEATGLQLEELLPDNFEGAVITHATVPGVGIVDVRPSNGVTYLLARTNCAMFALADVYAKTGKDSVLEVRAANAKIATEKLRDELVGDLAKL